MSLVNLIKATNRSEVSDDNGKWRQFILDHIDFIKNRSEIFTIPDNLMYLYRYDLKRFLKEIMQRQEDIAWIFLLLNDLKSDFDFYTPGDYIVPTDALITDFYISYKTISKNTA